MEKIEVRRFHVFKSLHVLRHDLVQDASNLQMQPFHIME